MRTALPRPPGGYKHLLIARLRRRAYIRCSMAIGWDLAYRMMKPALFSLDAETAHHLVQTFLSAIPAVTPRRDPPELACNLWGIEFSNPIGLAAGMDKGARAIGAWQALGFGFAELGTVTPRPQPGNEKPRLWRIREHRALINRLGFPSEGMDAIAPRIARIRRNPLRIRIAINIGPNKDTPVERVAADYAALAARFAPLADFLVVNVSSPNTPGLRNWQSPQRMRELFAAMDVATGAHRPPTLLKVAPDLDQPALYSLCDAALDLKLDGIVVSNTTIRREEAGVSASYPGGLSGPPLAPIARALIAAVYRHTGGRIPIVGVGGVAGAADAWGHITAGASLVELYTGLVYEGPGLPASIKAGLCALLKREGFRSISQAVGTRAEQVR